MSRIRKAVITAAGRGTRQYPASSAVQKEMFPLVDRDGLTKPVIQIIGQEALDAGIEEVCIVTAPGEEQQYRQYFRGIREELLPAFEGKDWAMAQSEHLDEFAERLSFVAQESPEGFGHAVWCAKDWVGDEPFLLLLGDHVYVSDLEQNCATQLATRFDASFSALTSVQPIPENELSLYGTIRSRPVDPSAGLYEAEHIVEKPTIEYARAHLRTPGLPDGQYLAHFGMHLFSPAVFDVLQYLIDHDLRERGEIQLTSAQERLRAEYGHYHILHTRGRRYDTGIPYGLMQTQLALALYSVHRKDIIAFLIEELGRWHAPQPNH